MIKIILVFFIFFGNFLYGNENPFNFENFNYYFLLLLFLISVFVLIVSIKFYIDISSFTEFIKSISKQIIYKTSFLSFNSTTSEKINFIKKVEKINFKKNNSFIIVDLKNESFNVLKLSSLNDINGIDIKNLLENKFDLHLFEIPNKMIKMNVYFNFLCIFKLNLINIKKFFLILTVFSSFLYWFLFESISYYFQKVIELLGIPGDYININISDFINFVSIEIFILAFLPFMSFLFVFPLTIIVTFIVLFMIYSLICIIYGFIKSNFTLFDSELFYFFFPRSLNLVFSFNIAIFILSFIFLIYFQFKVLLSIYKIEYPHHNIINYKDTFFLVGDYLEYTDRFTMVKINNNHYFSIGYDTQLLYYYDIVKLKNNFLRTQIDSSINDCSKISKSYQNSISKDWNKNLSLKFNIFLLSNKILNKNNMKKKNLNKIGEYIDRKVLLGDLYFEEIVDKCVILDTFTKKKFNYSNFENMDYSELFEWLNVNLSIEEKIEYAIIFNEVLSSAIEKEIDFYNVNIKSK